MNYSDKLGDIDQHYCADEADALEALLPLIKVSQSDLLEITKATVVLIGELNKHGSPTLMQQFLKVFPLDSAEGKALMVLAECLLRIPDSAVALAVMADQLQHARWGESREYKENKRQYHFLVRTTVQLLRLSTHLAFPPLSTQPSLAKITSVKLPINSLRNLSQAIVYKSLRIAIKKLAGEFVFANTVNQALAIAKKQAARHPQELFSFDMLGEAAITTAQANHFYQLYHHAIAATKNLTLDDVNISIKLSALTPRFECLQHQSVVQLLSEKLGGLLQVAAESNVSITIDAEESDKLDITLAVFSAILPRWKTALPGRIGLAVQAYSKRALAVLKFIDELALAEKALIPVRLVKGAYWDSEVKQAQVAGLKNYPVFIDKLSTDLSYLACAHFLLDKRDRLRPQFATHNPSTILHILQVAGASEGYEFQRLHGMGEDLYRHLFVVYPQIRCRVYCPVGDYRQLLPYLVRRILENGANSSMVRQLGDSDINVEQVAQHALLQYQQKLNAALLLPLPEQLYGAQRQNSPGVNLANMAEREALINKLLSLPLLDRCRPVVAVPLDVALPSMPINNPANGDVIATCVCADATLAVKALTAADGAFSQWSTCDANCRAELLEKVADLLQDHRDELLVLLLTEAGKTIGDAIDEWREAIDFCRYYASQCRQHFGSWQVLPGPEGEDNKLGWHGRGVFLCISPWNFPLAIFVGQAAAALAAGNTVLAKPAEATPLIACRVVELMHEAGIPADVVQCLPGRGDEVCRDLLTDERLAGVAFTGSLKTAQLINRMLAERKGAIIPFIAETGGQNAMIVDSSALAEQVVVDVLHSAFYSAGQRCSALRVLFVQREISAQVIDLLIGAIVTLRIGNPLDVATDIGPIINPEAVAKLQRHIDALTAAGKLLFAAPLPESLPSAYFIAPHIFLLDRLDQLTEEHFGPLLHIVIYDYSDLDDVVSQINNSGYGLTVGIQSRNQSLCQQLGAQLRVGNVYINRSMTGAVVGVQPFGGRGLSGTGPKAGGPHYLLRFATEKTITHNTAAIGGNAGLMTR